MSKSEDELRNLSIAYPPLGVSVVSNEVVNLKEWSEKKESHASDSYHNTTTPAAWNMNLTTVSSSCESQDKRKPWNPPNSLTKSTFG